MNERLTNEQLLEHSHFLYGIAILVLFLIQPVLGLLHHRQYLRTQKPTILGLIHRWYGRIIILVAMMNAWFGLGLADEPGEYWTAVGVSQGVLILLYILVVVVTWRRRRQLARKGSGEGFEQLRRREVNEGEGIPMGERSGAGVKM